MRSMDLRTPKGLPQRMHSKGSSSFKVTALIAALVKLMRGSSEMTCSGQVTRQRPHCTQASSLKPSHGRFSSSSSAPVGQARSEEHTSELQSLMRISYAVFCLKKKNNQHTISYFTNQNKAHEDFL